MKRRIITLISIIGLLLPLTVNAATGSIKASTSSSKVTLNNTFTVTVKVSSDGTLGSWDFGVSYDSSKLSLQSGDTRIVGYGDGTYSSKSYTYKFKAIATGSATIRIDSGKIADWNTDSYISTSTGGTTVTISEAVSIVYSSDNNLSSLSIEGFEISPVFSKNTLEYTVNVLPTTTTVKISAKTSSNKAKLSGVGDIQVVEGENVLPVVVTAENGATKTYTIKLTVPEKNPIEVTVGKVKYQILRKLPEELPLNFIAKTIKIGEEEIPALYNEKTKITLVYAKDEKGIANFYIYEKEKIKEKYITINSETLNINIVKTDQLLKGFIKTNIKINNENIESYQINEGSKFYIIYGTDVLTNKTGFYSYDSVNKTIQLFAEDNYNYLLDKNDSNKLIIYILSGSLGIFIIITILMTVNKRKYNKIVKKLSSELPDYKNKDKKSKD